MSRFKLNVTNFKKVRDSVAKSNNFTMNFYFNQCGIPCCIMGHASNLRKQDNYYGETRDFLNIGKDDFFYIALGEWSKKPIEQITKDDALAFLDKVIETGAVKQDL
jgi:hypothetical protein